MHLRAERAEGPDALGMSYGRRQGVPPHQGPDWSQPVCATVHDVISPSGGQTGPTRGRRGLRRHHSSGCLAGERSDDERRVRRYRLLCAPLLAALAAVAPAAANACGSAGYSYAGVSSRQPVAGVGAVLTAIAAPLVKNGHVAGWVGVGGPGLGPRGTSEWIQVGFSGFPGLTVGSLYYEVALPGQAPTYHELMSNVASGTRHRIAVVEMGDRHGTWRIWVDGHPASRPYHLPSSHGAWRGVATAENWGGGLRACNEYAYRFDRISLTTSAGGAWHKARAVDQLRGGSNRLLLSSPSSFVARTTVISATRTAAARPASAASDRRPAPAPAPAAAPAPTVAGPAPADPAPAPDPTAVDAAPANPPRQPTDP